MSKPLPEDYKYTPKMIPDFMLNKARWVVCKHDKVPTNPVTGVRASGTNFCTAWSTYDICLDAVKKGKYVALGFIVTPDTNIVGIDIDDCIPMINAKGVIKVEGQEPRKASTYDWLQKYKDSVYMELSGSGKGIHAFIEGVKTTNSCKVQSSDGLENVEMYDRHFIIFTGNALNPNIAKLEPNQVAIDDMSNIINSFSPCATKKIAIDTDIELDWSRDDIENKIKNVLARIRASKEASNFENLYSKESLVKDASSSENAFVQILVRYTENAAIIDELYRRSKLFECCYNHRKAAGTDMDKWDNRGDYVVRTIKNAIVRKRNYYNENLKGTKMENNLTHEDLKASIASENRTFELKYSSKSIPKEEKTKGAGMNYTIVPSCLGLSDTRIGKVYIKGSDILEENENEKTLKVNGTIYTRVSSTITDITNVKAVKIVSLDGPNKAGYFDYLLEGASFNSKVPVPHSCKTAPNIKEIDGKVVGFVNIRVSQINAIARERSK